MQNSAEKPNYRRCLVVCVALIGLVFALWLPFGFQNRPIAEEWGYLARADRGLNVFDVEPDQALRPFTYVWFYVAYAISPDTSIGLHILLIIFLALKGIIAYFLMRVLFPRNGIFAFAVALLFVIFPADRGIMNFRGLNIHATTGLYMIALYLLVLLWKGFRQTWVAVLCVLGMWLSLILLLGIYESYYPLLFATPLLILLLERRISRKLIALTTAWLVVPIPLFLLVLRAVFVTRSTATYQASILDLSDPVQNILRSLFGAYRAHFFDGWKLALKQISATSWLAPLATGIGIASGLLAYRLWRSFRENTERTVRVSFRPYLVMLTIGLVFIGLNFLPYTITSARFDTWRVFYLSGFGGALAVVAIFWLVSSFARQHQKLTFSAMVALSVGVAFYSVLIQHKEAVDFSYERVEAESRIVKAIPRLQKATAIFILISPELEARDTSYRLNAGIGDALKYIYRDYDNLLGVNFCVPADNIETTNYWTTCQFDDQGVQLFYGKTRVARRTYDQVVIFDYQVDRSILLQRSLPASLHVSPASGTFYHPEQLIDSTAPPPSRAKTFLNLASSTSRIAG